MKLSIGGFKDISTIDYPGEVVSVIFFCGCPFRCPFCQNSGLVSGDDCKDLDLQKVSSTLEKYSQFTTGTCITGGEPCMQKTALAELLPLLKRFGKIKIDTNGFYPDVIKQILDLDLIDYIAVDIKAPYDPVFYARVVNLPNKGDLLIKKVKESLSLINSHRPRVFLEIRTTIVPGLIEKKEEIEAIASENQADCFTLQQFRSNMGTLDPSYEVLISPSREALLELGKIAREHHQCVKIRSLEMGEEQI